MAPRAVSLQTRKNWLADAGLFGSAVLASLTGVYFLFLPFGGIRGGQNPWAAVRILFERHTWEDLHLWAGLAMIAAAVVHLAMHWNWVSRMAKRSWGQLWGRGDRLSSHGRWNLTLNAVVALSCGLAAVSGLYFLVSAGHPTTGVLSRQTWVLIHTWSGSVMIVAAVLHLAIHWRWVTKVTRLIVLPGAGGRSGGVGEAASTAGL